MTPTVNTWESEFDAGAILKNLFSGISIQTFFRTPPFAQWLAQYNGAKGKEEKLKKQDKETTDALKDAAKRRGWELDRPTNIKASTRQLFQLFAFNRANQYNRVGEWLQAYNQMANDYDQYLLASWQGTSRPDLHDTSIKSIEMMEKMFDSLGATSKKMHELMKDLNTIINALNEKPECATA